jgi:hypothetical protein
VRAGKSLIPSELQNANIIFGWLESLYPEILSPTPQQTQETQGIFFRYYPDTNVYNATYHGNWFFID